MTDVFTESAQPTSHYLHWQAIPSGRWLTGDEVRDALGVVGVTDTTPGVVDQAISYLEELGYLRCSRTVESRRNPVKPKPWELPRGDIREIVARYWREELHRVPIEADLYRLQQERVNAAREARADEDRKLDEALRRRGLTPQPAEKD